MPIFFLSGALFPLTGLPQVMEIVTRIDPLTYGVDGMRAVLIGASNFGLLTDLSVLLIITAVLLVVGSYLFEKIEI